MVSGFILLGMSRGVFCVSISEPSLEAPSLHGELSTPPSAPPSPSEPSLGLPPAFQSTEPKATDTEPLLLPQMPPSSSTTSTPAPSQVSSPSSQDAKTVEVEEADDEIPPSLQGLTSQERLRQESEPATKFLTPAPVQNTPSQLPPSRPIYPPQNPQGRGTFQPLEVPSPHTVGRKHLTLETILNELPKQAIDLHLLQAETRSLEAQKRREMAKLLPNLGVDSTLERTSGSMGTNRGTLRVDQQSYRSQIRATLNLNLGGREFFQWKSIDFQRLQKQCQWEETLNRRTLDALTAYYQWQRELSYFVMMQALLKEMRRLSEQLTLDKSITDVATSEAMDYQRSLSSRLIRPALLDQQLRTLRAETSANQYLSQLLIGLNRDITNLQVPQVLNSPKLPDYQAYQTPYNLSWLEPAKMLPEPWQVRTIPLLPEKLLSISVLQLSYEASAAAQSPQKQREVSQALSLSNLLTIAKQNRPLLAQRYLQLAVIEYAFKAKRADLLSPTLLVDASVRNVAAEVGQPEHSTRYYGGLSWYPLQGLGQSYLAEQADMQARREASRLAYEATFNQVTLNLQNQLLQYQLLEKQYQVAESKLRDTLNLVQDLKEGQADALGVWLRTMTVWSDAQSEYLSTVRDLNLIQLQILAELGLLTPEWLLKHVLIPQEAS
jgi:outer membrane protein TolC